MDTTEIQKLRRFSLTVAVILATLVLAGVKIDVPVHVSPLGIPMTIERPDLLTLGLVVVAIYTIVKYIYFAMFIHASPMRARRELATRIDKTLFSGTDALEAFRSRVQSDVNRYFPHVGKTRVTFEFMQDANGCQVRNLKVPRFVKLLCRLEDIDFLLPIVANVIAVSMWVYRTAS